MWCARGGVWGCVCVGMLGALRSDRGRCGGWGSGARRFQTHPSELPGKKLKAKWAYRQLENAPTGTALLHASGLVRGGGVEGSARTTT